MSNIGNKEIFSKNLHYYITATNRTQKEVANAIGVTPASLNEWIKGKKYPRIDKIELLAMYFGILKSDLIEDKGVNKTLPQPQMLTEGENMLLDMFRRVPDNKQQMILDMIQIAVKNH